MQGVLRPAPANTTRRCPNRRTLRRPLKIVVSTRAARALVTTTRTHFEPRRDRSESREGAVTIAGPALRVRGLGMTDPEIRRAPSHRARGRRAG